MPIQVSGKILTHPLMRKIMCSFVVLWQILWNVAPYIPPDERPPIDVTSLNAWDKSMFIILPHQLLTHIQCPFLDVLSAIPYTIHVIWPPIFLVWTFFKCRKLTLPYINCFGFLCVFAVAIQLVFPTAPPWYYDKYGFAPASYHLPGDPAGLARVDSLFHTEFYLNTFIKSPVVFGAFPSLHVGWPTLMALFLCIHVLPCWQLRLIPCTYVLWVSFAVVYLHHHYVADVLGGMFLAWLVYELLGPHRENQGYVHTTETSPV